jgi:hypothetical protein
MPSVGQAGSFHPTSSSSLPHLVELTEAAAYADVFRAAPSALGLEVEVAESHTSLFAPRFDLLPFNRIIGLGVLVPASETLVALLIERYRVAGMKNFGVQLSPDAQPGVLPHWLSTCGLRVGDAWTKMYRPGEGDPHIKTDLRLERIEARLAPIFGEVACAGFGITPDLAPVFAAAVGREGWHHYLAWDDMTPVAVAALFVHNGVGWLGMAATLPSHRRRGAQGALMAMRVRDGIRSGCRWLVTEAVQRRLDEPNPSFHNMVRNGFMVAYHRPNIMPAR